MNKRSSFILSVLLIQGRQRYSFHAGTNTLRRCLSQVSTPMVDSRRYCAYLLRGWRERAEDSGPGAWRFRLRDVQTGEERGFPSLEAITVFLAQEFEREEEDAAPAKEQDERPGQ